MSFVFIKKCVDTTECLSKLVITTFLHFDLNHSTSLSFDNNAAWQETL